MSNNMHMHINTSHMNYLSANEVRQMMKEKQLRDMVEQHRFLSKTLSYAGAVFIIWAIFTLFGILYPKRIFRPKKWYMRVLDLIRMCLCIAFLSCFFTHINSQIQSSHGV